MAHEIEGKTPDEITQGYPQLSLADVHAALAYYWDHKDDIDKETKEADDFVEQLKAATGPGLLARKLGRTDADNDSVSS